VAEARDYFYQTEIEWQADKHGQVQGAGLAPITTGAPPEFKGAPAIGRLSICWVVEQLLHADVFAIAEFSKIAIVSFSASAKGKLEKVEGGTYQITEIVVKPRVVIASANDLPRMPRILEKAKENCFISNSIKSKIKIEPEVFHHQTPASPCPLGEAPE
jgi:organic hydroperoxide reductase OsmC/OhrA